MFANPKVYPVSPFYQPGQPTYFTPPGQLFNPGGSVTGIGARETTSMIAAPGGNGAMTVHNSTTVRPAGFKVENFGITVRIRNNKFFQYNFFVKQYNTDTNRISNLYLKKVPQWWFMDIKSLMLLRIALVLCLVPVVCYLFLFFAILRFIFICRASWIVCSNKKTVPNPFENMIYAKSLGSNNEFYEFTSLNQINTFSQYGFSSDWISKFTSRYESVISEGNSVKVMFYSSGFAAYYNQINNGIMKSISITILMIILSGVAAGYSGIILKNNR